LAKQCLRAPLARQAVRSSNPLALSVLPSQATSFSQSFSSSSNAVDDIKAKLSAVASQQKGPSGRPISPHVTIFKFPITALSSITNRVTGVALSVGFMGMAFVALKGSCDLTTCVYTLKANYPLLTVPAKAVVAFPFVYHFAAGARHLYWDQNPEKINTEEAETSSKYLFGASAGAALVLALVNLPENKE
jgi:succinate dehydrogenase (ubiquinone) cytochrome b560 subunit